MERKQDKFRRSMACIKCMNIALPHLNQITQLNSVSSLLGLTATLVPDGQGSADPLYLSFWQLQHRTLCRRAVKSCCDFISF